MTKQEKGNGNASIEENWADFSETSDEHYFSETHVFWKHFFYRTKFIIVVVLALLVIALVIVSKSTLLILTWNLFTPHSDPTRRLKTVDGHLRYSRNETNIREDVTSATDVYFIWALFLLIVMPYLCNVIFYVYRLLTKSRTDKFSWVPLLGALVTSTFHTVGLSIFVFTLLPSLDPFAGVLYCCSVSLLPAVFQTIHYDKKKSVAFGALFSIISIGLWGGYAGAMSQPALSVTQIALFIIAPIAVSAEGLENFLPETDQKKVLGNVQKKERTHGKDGMASKSQEKPGKMDKTEGTCSLKDGYMKLKTHIYEGRYIIYLIVNLWKILLMFIMVMLIFGSSCVDGIRCMKVLFLNENTTAQMTSPGFGNTLLYVGKSCSKSTPFLVAFVGMVSSFVCHRLCVAAFKIVAQEVSFYIPLIVSPVVVFCVVVGATTKLSDVSVVCTFPFPWWEGNVEAVYHAWLYGFFAFLSGYIALIVTSLYVWTTDVQPMEDEDRIFYKSLYCGALFETSVLLNRWRKKKEEFTEPEDQNSSRTSPPESSDGCYLYLCATMWHETEREMKKLLVSIFRMDIVQCLKDVIPPKYNSSKPKNKDSSSEHKDPPPKEMNIKHLEVHIFFDDAIVSSSSCSTRKVESKYVKTFRKLIAQTARDMYRTPELVPKYSEWDTSYGKQIKYRLGGGHKLTIHLKDNTKVRNKKRWSQVMYMYYILQFKLLQKESDPKKQQELAERMFILTLDGDVDFQPEAVRLLLDRMKKDDVGAACGRIHPVGTGPMVWYQKFEYAVSHWLIKSTEHVTGCVLCCPGCFSLFRGSALIKCDVLKRYTAIPTNARQVIQYDQGEDRWLCTLLLKQGVKIEFCAAADAYTYAPEGFTEFYKQRRRWSPSTIANIAEILKDSREIRKKNSNVSMPYIVLQGLWFASSIITPGALFLMIVAAINVAFPAITIHASFLINAAPVLLFVLVCFLAKEQHQFKLAVALSTLYALVMTIVLIGLARQAFESGLCSVTTVFSLFVAGTFVLAGIVHPQEITCLLHGPLFFIAIPSMSMLLMFYAVINLHNVSWGTRELQTDDKKGRENEKGGQRRKLFRNLRASCNCCTETKVVSPAELAIIERIDDLITRGNVVEERLDKMSRRFEDKMDKSQRDKNLLEVSEDKKHDAVDERSDTISRKLEDNKEKIQEYEKEAIFKDKKHEREDKFWAELISKYLRPVSETTAKDHLTDEEMVQTNSVDMRRELKGLRNTGSLAYLLLNAIFVTIVIALQFLNYQLDGRVSIHIPCRGGTLLVEPISMAFTVVFGILLIIQFLCMMFHRWKTFLHIYSTISFRPEIDISKEITEMVKQYLDEEKVQRTDKTRKVSFKRRIKKVISMFGKMSAQELESRKNANQKNTDDIKETRAAKRTDRSTSDMANNEALERIVSEKVASLDEETLKTFRETLNGQYNLPGRSQDQPMERQQIRENTSSQSLVPVDN